MTATSTLTTKNQTTVPKAVVKALGVKPSDQLVYEIEKDHVVLRARTGRLADLVHAPPAVAPPRRVPSQQKIDRAIGRHLAGEDRRTKRQWLRAQKSSPR